MWRESGRHTSVLRPGLFAFEMALFFQLRLMLFRRMAFAAVPIHVAVL
jgi:hypothetical protein